MGRRVFQVLRHEGEEVGIAPPELALEVGVSAVGLVGEQATARGPKPRCRSSPIWYLSYCYSQVWRKH